MPTHQNIKSFEKLLRWLLGVLLLTWGFSGGAFWSFLGFYLLASGAWGHCWVYQALRSR